MKISLCRLFCFCWCILGAAAVSLQADVKLPAVFSDHMVLQRDQAVPVWGEAAPGEKVIVRFRRQEKTVLADAGGKWMLKLDPLAAGGPDKLSVIAGNTVEIDDVLVGEVWLGSGQSNMAQWVKEYTKMNPPLATVVAGAPYPEIRQIGIPGPWQVYATGRWMIATTNHVGEFSAELFAFGVRLHQELGVPVGLILAAVSGSPSGVWISEDALKADADCQAAIQKFAATFDPVAEQKAFEARAAQAKLNGSVPCPLRAPGEVYCSHVGRQYETYVRPLIPYGIRGVLWDQGENGTGLVGVNEQYTVMAALLRGWRRDWGQGDFPFIYMQKYSGGGCAWDDKDPVTSQADAFTALPESSGEPPWDDYLRMMKLPNAGMVISGDLGFGQHPTNKWGYAQRAATVALGMVYGRKVEYYGPVYDSHTTGGNQVRVKFTHIGKGLAFKHGDKLQGFALSAEGKRFFWADATIDGDTVVVTCAQVSHPVAVRYGWGQHRPWANLFNKDGLPAVPFTTGP